MLSNKGHASDMEVLSPPNARQVASLGSGHTRELQEYVF